LRLKLLCDVGLVGLPNAGKSTFLAATTRAKPKIADYPFTTLKPQLGMVYVHESEFLLADIPGLIEGAHAGVGLGTRFLKHIERCGAILHIVDATIEDMVEKYHLIRTELEHYSELLSAKEEIIALNKCAALTEDAIAEKLAMLRVHTSSPIFPISAVAQSNLQPLLHALWEMVQQQKNMTD
jgi:GTPase